MEHSSETGVGLRVHELRINQRVRFGFHITCKEGELNLQSLYSFFPLLMFTPTQSPEVIRISKLPRQLVVPGPSYSYFSLLSDTMLVMKPETVVAGIGPCDNTNQNTETEPHCGELWGAAGFTQPTRDPEGGPQPTRLLWRKTTSWVSKRGNNSHSGGISRWSWLALLSLLVGASWPRGLE